MTITTHARSMTRLAASLMTIASFAVFIHAASSAADLPLTTGVPSAPTPADKKDEKKDEKKAEKKEGKKEEKKDDKKGEELSNDCCGHPGMIPVCRCVPITKKRPKTEYEMKCEFICVPGCGKFECKHLCDKHHGCTDAGCTSCCDQPCCDNATIRKKKTLMKKVVDEEYDAWEYKVEWVCAPCAVGCCTAPGCCDSPDGCGPAGRHGKPSLFGWLFRSK